MERMMGSELVKRFLATWLKSIPVPKRVVEIGSRDISGSVRDMFPKSEYIGIDLFEGPSVDVVADARVWRPEKLADLVLCIAVMEHIPYGQELVVAMHEMLVSNGKAIIMAGHAYRPHSIVDGRWINSGEEYYKNISQQDLERWMTQFRDVIVYIHRRKDVWGMGKK